MAMARIPVTLPAFCYPKKNLENPCACEDRPVELTHKTCLLFWRAKVGDTLREGDILAEAEADKKTVELPCPAAGRLVERCFEDGDTITFENVIAYMEAAPQTEAE